MEAAVAIYVIDDEPSVCSGCRMVLAEVGHRVETFRTGLEGQRAVLRDGCDILLLDLKLPDRDGMDILRAIRTARPHVLVVVMTGYSTVANAVEAMKIGAFDYLSKPFSEDELLITVNRAIEKKRLLDENSALRRALIDPSSFQDIVGANPRLRGVQEQIRRAAPTDTTVLLCGESGTGKELFARAVHALSPRCGQPFVAVDCSTLSPQLLESELFGHVKGSFTGAVADRAGVFEVASGGTLFLDDIANLSLETQGKLLRVLELHEYKPVGVSQVRTTDVRVVAATNRDLLLRVQEGTFREDLFYRLNVVPVLLPPLRERRDDIPRLAYHFLRLFCRKTGKRIEGFTPDALELLVNHDWPGNVRELKNIVERLVILADREVLDFLCLSDHLQAGGAWRPRAIPDTREDLNAVKRHLIEHDYGRVERAFLLKALESSGGNITQAARQVGMQRSNFSALMRKHALTSPSPAKPREGDGGGGGPRPQDRQDSLPAV